MSSPADRLPRLLRFLEQDPDNTTLQVEAFDCALAARQFEVAAQLIEQSQKNDPLGWQFRAATLALAQGGWLKAQDILEHLQASCGEHPAITHNLAYIAFAVEDFARAMTLLRPGFEAGTLDAAGQVLALRALHRLGDFDTALQWARQRAAQGTLAPEAAGVASLIAVDADQLDQARAWGDEALGVLPEQMEALVARASVALQDADATTAEQLVRRALAQNPKDGRASSALGFACMLKPDLAEARLRFEAALLSMPGHIGTWHGLGWCCLLAEDLPAALTAFTQALELDRNFSESHGGLAVVLAKMGDAEGANREIKLAQSLDGGDLASQYAAAILSGETQDLNRFRQFAGRALRSRGLQLQFPAGGPGKARTGRH